MSWSSWGRVRGSPLSALRTRFLSASALFCAGLVWGGSGATFWAWQEAKKSIQKPFRRVAEFSFFYFLFSLIGRQTMESSGKQGICTIQVPWCHDCHNLKRRTYHHSEVWKQSSWNGLIQSLLFMFLFLSYYPFSRIHTWSCMHMHAWSCERVYFSMWI